MKELAIGGFNLDYKSKQSRAEAINCLLEAEGNFYSVRSCAGLTNFVDTTENAIQSDLIFSDNLIFFVAGNDLYQLDKLGNLTNHGTVGGAGRRVLMSNSIPDDNQILILNGNGQAYVYQPTAGLNIVSDADFYASSFGSVLNERAYLARDLTNQFFASAVSDMTDYPTTAFASAEVASDDVVAPIAHRGGMWVLGTRTSEYWQYTGDTTFPLRQMKGAVYQRGCAAVNSVKECGDVFAFLADDFTVRMVSSTQMTKISNLPFELDVRDYTRTDDAYSFFVDDTAHKIYYITFPTQKVTWGYDFVSGQWHKRKSKDLDYWKINSAVSAWGKVVVGDSASGKLYYLDASAKTDAGDTITRTLRFPSISWNVDVTIPLIELDMETGVGLESGADPLMSVSYSKDGGNNYIEHSQMSLGKVGDYGKRVPVRQFGRVVRYRDFVVELNFTGAVEFRIYRAFIYDEEGL